MGVYQSKNYFAQKKKEERKEKLKDFCGRGDRKNVEAREWGRV